MKQRQIKERRSAASPQTSPAENLSAARIMARALAECAPDDARIALARAFCFRLVSAWWSALDHGGLPLRSLLQLDSLTTLPDPAAASADPNPNVKAMTKSVFTPISFAEFRLNETARIALPIFV